MKRIIRNSIPSVMTAFVAVTPSYASKMNHKKEAKQPNILWLICEDISPNLSFYGDSTAKTPNLDKLAHESMIFNNCFTTSGVSAPSRSCLITGMYPSSVGTMHMRTGMDVLGLGVRKYKDVNDGAGVDLNGNPIREYAAVLPEYVKCFTEYLREAGYYCTNNLKTDYQFAAPPTAWNDNSRTASWVNCPNGKPFFSVFSYLTTHESQIWGNKGLPLTVSPEKVPIPPYYPNSSIVRRDVARSYSNIELLDKEIGKMIQQLKDSGVYENTIIFFFSDNGGPLPRGKRETYDSGLHLPLIIRFPEAKNAGQNNDLISFVDMAPTILSMAGILPPKHLQGQAFLGNYKSKISRKYIYGAGDRFDDYSDRIRVVRDKRYLFVKNYYPQLPYYKDVQYRKQMDMMNELLLLRDQQKLSGIPALWFRPNKTEEELYDCQSDPFNVHNLINEPEYLDKAKELRLALDRWINTVGDMATIPEAQMIKQMWPNNIQPKTAKAEIEVKNKLININCQTRGASIGFILSDKKLAPNLKSSWQVYSKPLKADCSAKYLYVISMRIGYSESEIVEYDLSTKI